MKTANNTAALAQQLRDWAPLGAQLRQDSRAVQAGDVFVAYSGGVHDGRSHIKAAFAQGASAVLADAQGYTSNHSRVLLVADLKHALGHIAHHYYGKPSQQLACVGVTGTNGKSTVTHWVAHMLQNLQAKPAAVLGTLGAGLLGHTHDTGLTTPHACDTQLFLAQAASLGAGSASIEASSIGLVEGRLNGVSFGVAAFTNLTQDHLDYHGDMAAYAQAKRSLFDWEGLHTAVVNVDDTTGAQLARELSVQRPELNIITTGIDLSAQLTASAITPQPDASQRFTVHYQGHSADACLPALGAFNVANALTAIGCCLALGHSLNEVLKQLPFLTGVAGRMQVVGDAAHSHQPLVVVDYAHTPDGLEQCLQALRPIAIARKGALHALFGCGGDRDASKRPLMGAVAQRLADIITITNDNPRSEDPSVIAAHIASAAPKARIELNRAAAIQQAVFNAAAADVILIAGKGHETTQTIAGVSQPFSDVAQAQAALSNLSALSVLNQRRAVSLQVQA